MNGLPQPQWFISLRVFPPSGLIFDLKCGHGVAVGRTYESKTVLECPRDEERIGLEQHFSHDAGQALNILSRSHNDPFKAPSPPYIAYHPLASDRTILQKKSVNLSKQVNNRPQSQFPLAFLTDRVTRVGPPLKH